MAAALYFISLAYSIEAIQLPRALARGAKQNSVNRTGFTPAHNHALLNISVAKSTSFVFGLKPLFCYVHSFIFIHGVKAVAIDIGAL